MWNFLFQKNLQFLSRLEKKNTWHFRSANRGIVTETLSTGFGNGIATSMVFSHLKMICLQKISLQNVITVGKTILSMQRLGGGKRDDKTIVYYYYTILAPQIRRLRPLRTVGSSRGKNSYRSYRSQLARNANSKLVVLSAASLRPRCIDIR